MAVRIWEDRDRHVPVYLLASLSGLPHNMKFISKRHRRDVHIYY